MDAMSTLKITLPSIQQITEDFSQLAFKESEDFYFSARNKVIYYNKKLVLTEPGVFQLFHEIGHALAGHHHYESGVELLKIESEAWHRAKQIAHEYRLKIPEALIEHCLDSYRDWLHLRSVCPNCSAVGVESGINYYHCFNCFQKWTVPSSQRARCYRRKTEL